jgi:hypothetical protein
LQGTADLSLARPYNSALNDRKAPQASKTLDLLEDVLLAVSVGVIELVLTRSPTLYLAVAQVDGLRTFADELHKAGCHQNDQLIEEIVFSLLKSVDIGSVRILKHFDLVVERSLPFQALTKRVQEISQKLVSPGNYLGVVTVFGQRPPPYDSMYKTSVKYYIIFMLVCKFSKQKLSFLRIELQLVGHRLFPEDFTSVKQHI